MVELFRTGTLMYWWAALSATIFLKDWLYNLATVLPVFMFPHDTVLVQSDAVWALAQLGAWLAQFSPFAVVWGIIGILLALERLAGREQIEIRRSR
ncbi:MAG: hypothetical protein M1132_03750 [Chloroflexi bacterium]|nr:hypothetical protein [Chloroflexota bacterium]